LWVAAGPTRSVPSLKRHPIEASAIASVREPGSFAKLFARLVNARETADVIIAAAIPPRFS
jgi:hypothetical protein